MGAGESWADAMAGPNTTSVPSDNADRENRNNLILYLFFCCLKEWREGPPKNGGDKGAQGNECNSSDKQ
jgi:hypothetical protein